MFSFNAGRSRTVWQGFSFRWYWGDPVRSVWHDDTPAHRAHAHPRARAASRRRSPCRWAWPSRSASTGGTAGCRPARTSRCCCRFVIPETLLAVALLFLVTQVDDAADPGHDGAGRRAGDLPAVLSGRHRARAAAHDRQAVRGGGASTSAPRRIGAVRRVLLPMLTPAIFASTVLVFADVIDDFVIVRYLSGGRLDRARRR